MKRLLFVLACTLLATPIWAQNDMQSQEGPSPEAQHRMHNMHPPSPQEQLKRLTRELDLTADQQTQLKQIFADQEKMREQDHEAMQNASPEERRAHFQQTRQQVDAKIEAILTDAQKKKFADMRAHMKQRRMHDEGEGQQPPPPDSQP